MKSTFHFYAATPLDPDLRGQEFIPGLPASAVLLHPIQCTSGKSVRLIARNKLNRS